MTITERVHGIIVEELGIGEDEVRADVRFADDLGADSLDRIELMMACEEEFDIEISDRDAEQVKTVGDLCAYIERRCARKPSV